MQRLSARWQHTFTCSDCLNVIDTWRRNIFITFDDVNRTRVEADGRRYFEVQGDADWRHGIRVSQGHCSVQNRSVIYLAVKKIRSHRGVAAFFCYSPIINVLYSSFADLQIILCFRYVHAAFEFYFIRYSNFVNLYRVSIYKISNNIPEFISLQPFRWRCAQVRPSTWRLRGQICAKVTWLRPYRMKSNWRWVGTLTRHIRVSPSGSGNYCCYYLRSELSARQP